VAEDGYVTDYRDATVRLYVRVKANDSRDALMAQTRELFGDVQMLGRQGEPDDELAFITPYASEKTVIGQLEKLNGTVLGKLRLLD
jgi:hypothetical protein